MALRTTPRERALRVLEWGLTVYKGRAALACSFGGPTGLVLLDLVQSLDRSVPVYYLDTGLLFPETHALIKRVGERYGIEPIALTPELSLSEQAQQYGAELWATDPDRCCNLRKVQVQSAFLARFGAWITGIRRDQSPTRADVKHVAWDDRPGGLVKIAPLADWTEAECHAYLSERDLPTNTLHAQGYASIGCMPCTRALLPGEAPRAGRWPDRQKTECGLHLSPVGSARA